MYLTLIRQSTTPSTTAQRTPHTHSNQRLDMVTSMAMKRYQRGTAANDLPSTSFHQAFKIAGSTRRKKYTLQKCIQPILAHHLPSRKQGIPNKLPRPYGHVGRHDGSASPPQASSAAHEVLSSLNVGRPTQPHHKLFNTHSCLQQTPKIRDKSAYQNSSALKI